MNRVSIRKATAIIKPALVGFAVVLTVAGGAGCRSGTALSSKSDAESLPTTATAVSGTDVTAGAGGSAERSGLDARANETTDSSAPGADAGCADTVRGGLLRAKESCSSTLDPKACGGLVVTLSATGEVIQVARAGEPQVHMASFISCMETALAGSRWQCAAGQDFFTYIRTCTLF